MRSHPWLSLVLLLPIACSAPRKSDPSVGTETDVVRELRRVIEHEMRVHELPALAIALVDDQRVVWSEGFGYADPARRTPATASTVFRVGSVSKLLTDLAVMQLVERDALDLDTPVRDLLPEFKIAGRRGPAITLRHLMSHRAGILREPPVGSYFDSSEPGLAATVASVRNSRAIYEVGSRTKYSNAGVAIVGRVLEVTQKTDFATYLQRAILAPCGMGDSSFALTPALRARLAKASMWTHDGRHFDAPVFELGTLPAGNLYASVDDLANFLRTLFKDGGGVLSKQTLDSMYEPQGGRFGLGFALSKLDGEVRCGHGGAIYGHATQLSFLPNSKLGVVTAASLDCANAVTGRLAQHALRLLLASRAGKPLAARRLSEPLPSELAERLVGKWIGDRTIEVTNGPRGPEIFDGRGIYQLRRIGEEIVIDDRHRYAGGVRLERAADPSSDILVFGRTRLTRSARRKPAPVPTEWRGLIGEYGPDHNVLYVHERDGHLYALIEWFEFDRLRPLTADTFAFPPRHGMYHGETLRFVRDANGSAREARIGDLVFARRPDQRDFTIEPVAPIDELRRRARAAKPPTERDKRKPVLVDLAKLDPTLRFDIRYAGSNNFMRNAFYQAPRAFLEQSAAQAMLRAHRALARHGYGLLIHDAYRPWSVTKMFWDATPASLKHFVADPSKGSRHNRGCAVDVTLYELATGRVVEMPSGYDEFTPRAYPLYRGGSSLQRWHRDLLRTTMQEHGFSIYEHEWWHFDYRDWRSFPILDLTFEQIDRR